MTKTIKTIKIPEQDCLQIASTRRAFVSDLFAKGVGVVGLSVVSAHLVPTLHGPEKSPKELSLQEADFYAPHSLLG